MFKFRFECSDEARVRANFEHLMLQDIPCGKGILGDDLLRRGVHLIECGEQIKGFYIDRSEDECAKGSPLRVSFHGKFAMKANQTVFEVYIYPQLLEFLLILVAYILISIAASLSGFLFSTVVFILFMVGYYKSIKETARFFQQWIT